MPLGTEVNVGTGNVVLDARRGRSSPLKGAQPSSFRFMSIVAKTAEWMKTPLGTEGDLGPGHIVLDGVPALREKGTAASPLSSARVY